MMSLGRGLKFAFARFCNMSSNTKLFLNTIIEACGFSPGEQLEQTSGIGTQCREGTTETLTRTASFSSGTGPVPTAYPVLMHSSCQFTSPSVRAIIPAQSSSFGGHQTPASGWCC